MGIIARIMGQPDDRISVRAGGREISYARLKADVDAAASRFAGQGITPGKAVGIRAGHAENGHSYANWVAHLAVMKLGAAHVSMTDKGAIKAALAAGHVDVAVGNFETLIDVPLSVKRIEYHLDPAQPSEAVADFPNNEQSSSRLNITSGTTGRPKFIAWDAEMIERRVDQIGDLATADTNLFPLLHLKTTAGFRYPLATWAAGGCVLLPIASTGLDRDREVMPLANLVTCSPSQLKERLAQIPGEWAGRHGRTIMLLGGRLPSALRDAALERACSRLLVSYGATETGSIATGSHDVIERHPGAVGFLREGVEVEIVGPNHEPLEVGKAGLVRARTGAMASKYEEGPASTGSGHFRDGWFYSGDIGRLYEDGLLAIEGRAGDVLNLGGWKISANDLEAKLSGMPGVKDICAVSLQLAEGDMLALGIVCDDDFDLRGFSEQVHQMLGRRRRFHVIRMPSVPRNAMGKIPRPLIASQLTAIYRAVKKKNVANA